MDPVAIFWDIENCPTPRNVRPEDVAGNIMLALRAHLTVNVPVKMFSAYGDFSSYSRRLTKAYHRTGVKLVHVPSGRKYAVDKTILAGMFFFALDYRRPASILLISGNIDFAPALHVLGNRGYKIIVVIPSRVKVSSAMKNAGDYLWDWSSVARGKEIVPQGKTTIPHQIKKEKATTTPDKVIASTVAKREQNELTSQDHVAIFWDIENCPVPRNSPLEDVAGNIKLALRTQLTINVPVKMFSAYGDFSSYSKRLTEAYHKTGVELVHVPNGRKDAADNAILVDMFSFALDNRRPASILLISGDVDFAHALHVLGHRGYKIIVAIPSKVKVSSAMKNAGKYLWDWSNVARGEGIVPQGKTVIPHRIEEEKATSTPDKVTAGTVAKRDQNELAPQIQPPSDLSDLKGQLVKLLELSGGSLSLKKLPPAYKKMFGRSLCVSKYGVSKLSELLRRMNDLVTVEKKDTHRFVSLSKSRSRP